jgi:hypothetical protein
MMLEPASAAWSDAEFLAAFHACTLPPSCFHHADHLRLAWLHIHQIRWRLPSTRCDGAYRLTRSIWESRSSITKRLLSRGYA